MSVFKKTVITIGCLSLVGLANLATPNALRADVDRSTALLDRDAGMSPRLRLGAFSGEWIQVLKFHPNPGQPPVVVDGEASNALILGGRFAQLRGVAQVGDAAHESLNIIGFDETTGLYTLYAADNMGKGSSSARGEYDPQTRTFVLSGYMQEVEGESAYPYEVRYTFESLDRFVTRVIRISETGGEITMLEVENTRL